MSVFYVSLIDGFSAFCVLALGIDHGLLCRHVHRHPRVYLERVKSSFVPCLVALASLAE